MWGSGVKVELGILPVSLCPWLTCFMLVTLYRLGLSLPICHTETFVYLSYGFSLLEGSSLEKGSGQSISTFSLLLTDLRPHSPCVLSANHAGTHLHVLCPVPVPHRPGASEPLSSLHLLGIKEPRAQNLESGNLHFGQYFSFAADRGSHGWLSMELGWSKTQGESWEPGVSELGGSLPFLYTRLKF